MKKFHPLTGEPTNKYGDNFIRDVVEIRRSRSNKNIGKFGMTRTNPDGSPKFHSGVDWLAAPGTPVFAAHGGIISDAGFERGRHGTRGNTGYGIRLYLIHRKDAESDSTETIYAHLCAIPPVAGYPGIEAGQLVGWVGRTGNVMDDVSIPTHLHFGVRVSGNWVDPLEWLSGS